MRFRHLLRGIRSAARPLRQAPGIEFTAALLHLAFGETAASAICTFGDNVLLRLLSLPRQHDAIPVRVVARLSLSRRAMSQVPGQNIRPWGSLRCR